MPPEIFKVIANFVDADGAPLTDDEYSVGLRDEDRFFDDKLGDSALDSEGVAEFIIFVADILSIDSPGERTPDLYFVVKKNGDEIFRSEVFPQVNFDTNDPVTGRPKSLTLPFGPFKVSTG